MNLNPGYKLLSALVAFLIVCSALLIQCYANPVENNTVFVAPHGSDDASGTKDHPLATVTQAIHRLLISGGRVVLLEGEYSEVVHIPKMDEGNQSLPALSIEALEPGKVRFNGGKPLEDYQPWQSIPGVYLMTVDKGEAGGLGVWEERYRIRYRELADEAGVIAHPGSFVVLDENRILVNIRDGQTPEQVELWISEGSEFAMRVERENTQIHGIDFRNYLGVRMSGPIRVEADQVTISNVRILNSTTGILVRPEVTGTRIEKCVIQEVGTGVYNLGNDSHIVSCLIEAGSGAFAIEVQQHMRNAIRWYHPAKGGVVKDCVTRGFWAGLYVKTISDDLSRGARPVDIENNTFIDGIKAGSGAGITQPQPLNRYLNNIIGPNEDRQEMQGILTAIQSTVEGNHFYDGQDPFVELSTGNLRIRENAIGGEQGRVGSSLQHVEWKAVYAKSAWDRQQTKELRFLKAPILVASKHGARVSVYLNRQAAVTLRYRKVGAGKWDRVEVKNQSLSEWPTGIVVPRWDQPDLVYRASVAMLGNELQAGAVYEFQVECQEGTQKVQSDLKQVRIAGGPKAIHVRSLSDNQQIQGSDESAFSDLQEALDHALPGDTVLVGTGVFTRPAILGSGGTASEPITIQGQGEGLSILDGAKLYPAMLELRGVQHVVIRDLQIRWFGRYGIYAKNSQAITVERCRFLNATVARRMSPNGMGIRLEDTPGCRVVECVFTANEYGVDAIRSPNIHLQNNTAFLNLYSAIRLISSSQDSSIIYNSFTFTGNDAITIQEPDARAFTSLKSDYNNLGTVLRQDTAPLRPENDFSAPPRYAGTGMLFGKGIIRAQVGKASEWHRFTRMQDWQKFANKDHHSIFADPAYVEPLRGDFRLLPESPNQLENGMVIGAINLIEH